MVKGAHGLPLRSLFFKGTGAPPEDGVGRAPADGTCGQRDNAEPSPWTHRAAGRKAQQNQPDDDACNTVQTANIEFHIDPLDEETGNTRPRLSVYPTGYAMGLILVNKWATWFLQCERGLKVAGQKAAAHDHV
jgi:hypothetical protein